MITKEESQKIVMMRCLATLLIVSCHYVSWIPPISFTGQILNVGVPLFFILSGFLYGQKSIDHKSQWIINQFEKITIPLYIYYFLSMFLLFILGRFGKIDIVSTLKVLLNLYGFAGGSIGHITIGHLWFTSFILACYLITPLLQKMRDNLSLKHILFIISTLIIMDICWIISIKPFAFVVWIPGAISYVIAYFMGKWNKHLSVGQYLLLTIAMIGAMALRLGMKMIADSGNSIASIWYDRVIAEYTHCYLAFWLFFTLYFALNIFQNFTNKIYPAAKIIASYSYEIYIVHYMFLVGGVSFQKLTDSLMLNTLLFIAATSIYAIILKRITVLLSNHSQKHS